MHCPIPGCPIPVAGPLRICTAHWSLVPQNQQDMMDHYARTKKGGPGHIGAFERAVETICLTIKVPVPVMGNDRPEELGGLEHATR